jgi:hypothetical protein
MSKSILGRTIAVTAVIGGVLAAGMSVASAEERPVRRIDVGHTLRCDTSTGDLVGVWTLHNNFDQSLTVGNVTSVPAGAATFPGVVNAGATVSSNTQHIPNSFGRVEIDVTWADGQTARGVSEIARVPPFFRPCWKGGPED